jgi:hypothetical protein
LREVWGEALMLARYLAALGGPPFGAQNIDMAIKLAIAVCSEYERRNVDAEKKPWLAWKWVLPRGIAGPDVK